MLITATPRLAVHARKHWLNQKELEEYLGIRFSPANQYALRSAGLLDYIRVTVSERNARIIILYHEDALTRFFESKSVPEHLENLARKLDRALEVIERNHGRGAWKLTRDNLESVRRFRSNPTIAATETIRVLPRTSYDWWNVREEFYQLWTLDYFDPEKPHVLLTEYNMARRRGSGIDWVNFTLRDCPMEQCPENWIAVGEQVLIEIEERMQKGLSALAIIRHAIEDIREDHSLAR